MPHPPPTYEAVCVYAPPTTYLRGRVRVPHPAPTYEAVCMCAPPSTYLRGRVRVCPTQHPPTRHSMMPWKLALVPDPSYTAMATPAASSTSEKNSCRLGLLFSMKTEPMAVTTGMDAL